MNFRFCSVSWRTNRVFLHVETIRYGDVLSMPAEQFIPNKLMIPPRFVRLPFGSALLATVHATTKPVLLPQGGTVVSVTRDEPVVLLPVCSLSSHQGNLSFFQRDQSDPTSDQKEALVTLFTKHQA